MTYKLPLEWLQPVKMARIIVHWSAGAYRASDLDKEHYHFIIEGTGNIVRGDHTIADNVNTADDNYAAHTRGCNTGSIGVSFASMAGAIESPFNPGKFPLTETQWARGMEVIAHLASFYKIPVTDKTILTHAEVQPNLGIKQNGKWDITRLPFDASLIGAKACGDKMRRDVKARL
ncbi:N-acetylmuramoyl-L-alanine amidase [Agrobacterium tumefaciens]|uniref:N-acetylmuramoyl-L-alanine amidase n=1 Tax=Agrobacterium tumefaciens TaxID=358 RepID=A0AAP9E2Y6_AGRTU|nr:N-acetylmuramoyl-L-alanine amidase [Agrobacterium tumefaciens]NSZ57755.1 N-acetylmuramoyl-L-alanine amidase [Agrobacterium tumefaciens]QDY93874.1 N-acetylmuramoyl-L-alanine amidase [Agrobacterium tumefaciens]UXS48946.1 N-acetylmuramoyl-L-alanine amidase [Agrobacterium tumefaciens]UXS70250.1 N-acetylmuramoyl-L-alanine amidase [Agrobacterium tumefaciens]UXS77913.1 N-acetylmuramoyl-L-alanine amidase [Agrobacterium tumefaciens]